MKKSSKKPKTINSYLKFFNKAASMKLDSDLREQLKIVADSIERQKELDEALEKYKQLQKIINDAVNEVEQNFANNTTKTKDDSGDTSNATNDTSDVNYVKKPKKLSDVWNLTKILQNDETPSYLDFIKLLLTTIPTTIVDSNNEMLNRTKGIINQFLERANEIYDPQIQQYERQLQDLDRYREERLNQIAQQPLSYRFSMSYTPNTQETSLELEILARREKLNTQLELAKKDKSDYIQDASYLADPIQQIGLQIRDLATNHGWYKQLVSNKDVSFTNALNLRETSESTFLKSKDLIDKELTKLHRATIKYKLDRDALLKADEQILNLSIYILLNGLPKSIKDLPKSLLQIAMMTFYNDETGKNDLDNKEFVDDFYRKTIILEEQIPQYSNSIEEAIKKLNSIQQGKSYDQLMLEQKKLEYLLLKSDADNAKDVRRYESAIRQLDEAIKNKETYDIIRGRELNDDFATAALKNAGTALWNQGKDKLEGIKHIVTNDYDLYYLDEIRLTVNDYQKGKNLTAAQKDLMSAKALSDMSKSMYDFSDVHSYTWGDVAGESLEFMLLFMLTAGAAATLEKGFAKVATKASQKMLGKAIEKNIAKYGKDWAVHNILLHAADRSTHAVGRILADATYAAALENTLGINRVMADAIKDNIGIITGSFDNNGNLLEIDDKILNKTRKDIADALWLSEKRNWVENFSEMMGEWGIWKHSLSFGGKMLSKNKKIGKILSSLAEKRSASSINEMLRTAAQLLSDGAVLTSKNGFKSLINKLKIPFNGVTFQNMLKRGRYSGFVGETLEEYYGIALNHLLGSLEIEDDPNHGWFWNLGNDMKKQSIDILGGIALSTVMLGGFGTANYLREQAKYNLASSKLDKVFGEKLAADIRRKFLFAKNEDISQILNDFISSLPKLDNNQYTKEEILKKQKERTKALFNYYGELIKYRAASWKKDFTDFVYNDKYGSYQDKATELGYTLSSYGVKRNIEDAIDLLKSNIVLQSGLPVEQIDKYLSENKTTTELINNIINDKPQLALDINKFQDTINAILAYKGALAFSDGVDMKLTHDVEDVARNASNHITKLIYEDEENEYGQDVIIPLISQTDPNSEYNTNKENNHLFLISGKLNTKFGTREVDTNLDNYAKGKEYVVVSDGLGNQRRINIADLKGYKFEDRIYSDRIEKIKDDEYNRTFASALDMLDSFLQLKNLNIGDKFIVDDNKIVTVLSSSREQGVTYSISDKDGSNMEVRFTDTKEHFADFIKSSSYKLAQNLTDLFTEEAKNQFKDIIENGEFVNRKKYIKPTTEEVENSEESTDESVDEPIDESIDESTNEPTNEPVVDEPVNEPVDESVDEPVVDDESDNAEDSTESEEPVIDDTVQPEPIVITNLVEPVIQKEPSKITLLPPVDNTNDEDQDTKINTINEEIIKSSKNIVGVSGFHYFKKVEGKIILHRRVHSVIGSMTDYSEEKNAFYEKVGDMYVKKQNDESTYWKLKDVFDANIKNDGSIESAITAVNDIIQEELNNKFEKNEDLRNKKIDQLLLELYFDHIKENYTDENEVNEALYGLSYILHESFAGNSTLAGSIIDKICRLYFDHTRTEELRYDDPRLTVQYNNKEIHISTSVEYKDSSKQLMPENAFNEIMSQLQIIKLNFDENGIKIVTDYSETIKDENSGKDEVIRHAFNMSGLFEYRGKTVSVAGEIDALAVYPDGSTEIIDFKTYNFGKYSYHEEYDLELFEYKHNLFFDTTFAEKRKVDENHRRSYAAQYAIQLLMYRMMTPATIGYPKACKVLLMGLRYNPTNDAVAFFSADENEDGTKKSQILRIIRPLESNGFQWKDGEGEANLIDLTSENMLDQIVKDRLNEQFGSILKQVNDLELLKLRDKVEELKINIDGGIRNDESFKDLVKLIDEYNEVVSTFKEKINPTMDAQFKNTIFDKFGELNDKYNELQNELTNRLEQINESINKLKEIRENQINYLSNLTSSDIQTYLEEFITDALKTEAYLTGIDGAMDLSNVDQTILQQFIEKLASISITYEYAIGENKNFESRSQYISNYINKHLPQLLQSFKELDPKFNYGKYLSESNDSNSAYDAITHPLQEKDWHLYTQTMRKSLSESVSDKDPNLHLVLLLSKPNFRNTAEFYIIIPEDKNDKNIYMQVEYQDGDTHHVFTKIDMNIGHVNLPYKTLLTESGNKFLQIVKSSKSKRIKIKNSAISRTMGEIKNFEGVNNEKNLLSNSWESKDGEQMSIVSAIRKPNSLYLYDIEYSPLQNDFAMNVKYIVNGRFSVASVVPGENGGNRQVRYIYSGRNKNTHPSVGTLVWLKKINYQEYPDSEKPVVPINLYSKMFSKKDAELVWDIVSGKHSIVKDKNNIDAILNSRFKISEDEDDKLQLWVTNAQVLQMLISYGNQGQLGSKQHVHIQVNSSRNGSNMLRLGGYVQGISTIDDNGNLRLVSKLWDLNDANKKLEFVDFMSNYIRINMSENFLSTRFNQEEMKTFKNSLLDYGTQTGDGKKVLLIGNSSIAFDSDDFSITTDKKAISGLGWYIKRGFINTQFKTIENPLISIDEESIIKDEFVDTLPNVSETVDILDDDTKVKVEEGDLNTISLDDYAKKLFNKQRTDFADEDEFLYRTTLKDNQLYSDNPFVHINGLQLIDEEKAKQHIVDLIGDQYVDLSNLISTDDFLEMCGDVVVLGRCRALSIQLSKIGVPGVEYHEAFHRIVELLISPKKREKLYKTFKTFYKNNYGRELTDKETAEMLANHFWYYMNEYEKLDKIQFSWNLIKTFKAIVAHIKLIKKMGDFDLYRFYRSAKNGKFKNIKPSEDAIKRFNKFSKKGYFNLDFHRQTLNGDVKLEWIFNLQEYRTLLNSISFILLNKLTQGHEIDEQGISKSTIKIDAEAIITSPLFMKIMADPEYGEHGKQLLANIFLLQTDENGTPVLKNVNGEYRVVRKKGADLFEKLKLDIQDSYKHIMRRHLTAQEKIDDQNKIGDLEGAEKELSQIEDPVDRDTPEDGEDHSIYSALEGHLKNQAEFDPLTTASERVKYFFSRIPRMEYVNVKKKNLSIDDPNSFKLQKRYVLNSLGLPEFYDFEETWRYALIKLHDCETLGEFVKRLRELAQLDYVFDFMYKKYIKLANKAFTITKENEHLLEENWSELNKHYVKDDDSLGTAISIYVSIRQALIDNDVIQSYAKGSEKDLAGSVKLQSTDYAYVAEKIRLGWTSSLLNNSKYFKIGKDGKVEFTRSKNPDGTQGVIYTSKKIENLATLLNTFSGIIAGNVTRGLNTQDNPLYMSYYEFEEGGKSVLRTKQINNIDIHNIYHLDALKEWFVRNLNDLGITITVADLNYALLHLYNDTTAIGLKKFLLENKFGEFTNYIEKKLASRTNMKHFWDNNKGRFNIFLSTLSGEVYSRSRSKSKLNVITVGGKEMYLITENNSITDRLLALLSKVDTSTLNNLLNDPYYSYNNESTRVFEALKEGNTNFKYTRVVGFKTDADGSKGIEWQDLSEIEEYISRYALLAQNYILTPTMADKTSFGVISGLKAFGFDYGFDSFKNEFHGLNNDLLKTQLGGTLDNSVAYSADTYEDGSLHVHIPINVLIQFDQYAQLEYNSARKALARYATMSEDDKVQNFHTSEQKIVLKEEKDGKLLKVEHSVNVIQGARLSWLNEIYIANADGTFTNIPLNCLIEDNKYKDEEANLDTAEKYFFGIKDGNERYKILEKAINVLIEAELEDLERVGILQKQESTGKYVTKLLDSRKLSLLAKWIQQNDDVNVTPKVASSDDSLIKAYVADMVVKGQMSHNEAYRLLPVGNVAFFTWQYDSETGRLTDLTLDLFKRLGGLASTGTNNAFAEEEYTCAEIEDVLVKKDILKPFADKFLVDSLVLEIKKAIIQKRIDEYNQELLENDPDSTLLQFSTSNESVYSKHVDKITEEVNQLNDILLLYANSILDNINNKVSTSKEYEKLRSDILKYIDEESLSTIENTTYKAKKSKYNALLKVEVADGATYISANMCKKLLFQIGKWNNSIKRAFEILENKHDPNTGKDYDDLDIRSIASAWNLVYTTIIGTQKYTAYGQRPVVVTEEDGKQYVFNETYYDKTAYFPLFDCICTGHMRDIYEKMKENEIDVLKVHSATKSGSKGRSTINYDTFDEWDKEGSDAYKKFTFEGKIYKLRLGELRKLFNTDPKERDEFNMGTLMQKVLAGVLSIGLKFKFTEEDGTEITYNAVQMRDQLMDAITNLSEIKRDLFRQKYFEETLVGVDEHGDPILEYTLNEKKFADRLKKEIQNRDASSELIDAFTVKDGEKMDVPLQALSSNAWVLSILTSTINKDIVDVSSPGNAFYQRSVFGMEGYSKMNFKGDDEIRKQYIINNGKRLLVCNDIDGSMDCVLSIDYFDFLFKKHGNLKNQSFGAKKQWLINHGIISGFKYEKLASGESTDFEYVNIDGAYEIYDENKELHKLSKLKHGLYKRGEWQEAKANIVGYRIPTLAASSIHAMRCVDVLPVVRDTIILPALITSITGSDFDIDKFFLSTLFYNQNEKDENGLTLVTTTFDLNSNDLEERKKYYTNRLIKLLIQVLTSNDNNISQLQGSIDSDTEPIKQACKLILKNDKNYGKVRAFDSTSLRLNVAAKIAFASGKDGIGPFALNNNNHVFTMLYNVKFKKVEEELLTELGLTDLSKSHDRHGRSILSWLSGLINAHVDVAKDPYISYGGVNKYTYNLVNLLIRTGYGQETFWFTSLPIMKKLFEQYKIASGVYMQNEDASLFSRQREKVESYFSKYVNSVIRTSNVTLDASLESITEYFKNTKNVEINKLIHALMMSNQGINILKSISTNLNVENTHKLSYGETELELTTDEIQLLIGYANFKLQEKAKNLADLVKYTKIDTKKYGKSLIEQSVYKLGLEGLTNPKTTPFEYAGITNMINDSFIGKKTDYAIDTMKDLLKGQLYEATGLFERQLNRLYEAIGGKQDGVTFKSDVAKMLIGKIKSKYFFNDPDSYCNKRGIDPRRLLIGNDSIYDRLSTIQSKIANTNDPEYEFLRDENGDCRNLLLSILQLGDVVSDEDVNYSNTNNAWIPTDEWAGSKFIQTKYLIQDSIKSDEVSYGWEDLLNDSAHHELQKFAEDLIVYAFITASDNGGKNDLFKYVPLSWRKGNVRALDGMDKSDSYVEFTKRMLSHYQLEEETTESILTEQDVENLILNYYWKDDIVPTKTAKFLSNGITYSHDNKYAPHTTLLFGAINDKESLFNRYEFPKYFKVLADAAKTGQRVYNVYKFVGFGQAVDKEGTSFGYPIYALTAQVGGKYTKGLIIYDYDFVYNSANLLTSSGNQPRVKLLIEKNSVLDLLDYDLTLKQQRPYYKYIYSMLSETIIKYITRKEFFAEGPKLLLLTIAFGKNTPKATSISQVNLQSLNKLASDMRLYAAANDSISDIQNIKDIIGGRLNNIVLTINRDTNLHLENIVKEGLSESKYTPSSYSDPEIAKAFPENKVKTIISKGLHVEFYKKRTTVNGKNKYDSVMTLSFPGENKKGCFELLAEYDIDKQDLSGYYSVHFKTATNKYTSPYASVALSNWDKNLLFLYLIYAIPEGAKVSTWGELSLGGVHAIENLLRHTTRFTGYLKTVLDESRPAVIKGTNENIILPIYEKTKTEPSSADMYVPKKPIVSASDAIDVKYDTIQNMFSRNYNFLLEDSIEELLSNFYLPVNDYNIDNALSPSGTLSSDLDRMLNTVLTEEVKKRLAQTENIQLKYSNNIESWKKLVYEYVNDKLNDIKRLEISGQVSEDTAGSCTISEN